MYTFENKICKKDEKEIWKNCTYPGIKENQYSVSNYGRIKNNDSGKILIPYKLVRDLKTENVYYIIKLKFYDSEKNIYRYKNFRLNRLIAWDFVPKNRDMNLCVMHINDNKLDNYYKNLKWGTKGENTRAAIISGRLNISGKNNHNNIYGESYIRTICKMMESGKTNKEILYFLSNDPNATIRKYPKIWSLISHIRAKDRFTDITLEYNYTPKFNLSQKDKDIIQMMYNGDENIDIMEYYGYTKISHNTALYSKILKCRKIIKICSTTRENMHIIS